MTTDQAQWLAIAFLAGAVIFNAFSIQSIGRSLIDMNRVLIRLFDAFSKGPKP